MAVYELKSHSPTCTDDLVIGDVFTVTVPEELRGLMCFIDVQFSYVSNNDNVRFELTLPQKESYRLVKGDTEAHNVAVGYTNNGGFYPVRGVWVKIPSSDLMTIGMNAKSISGAALSPSDCIMIAFTLSPVPS